MFSRPKILFLVSLLFVALLNPKFNPYLLFKFLIFYHSSYYKQVLTRNLQFLHPGWFLIAYGYHVEACETDATLKS